MKFAPAPLHGAYLIDLERRGDDRGFFARFFCEAELAAQGLEGSIAQVNTSFSAKKGTLRGLHYQLPGSAEVKIVRCLRGALWDAIVDLRPDSPTFRRWFGARLDADNRTMMYVPRGFAHAILTLTEDVEALYLVSNSYAPQLERGIRWDDPAIGVEWPITPVEISPKDAAWPDLDPTFHGLEQLRGLS
jgi:dTDP-4-dehydrorhamnose 3,5-epimerase